MCRFFNGLQETNHSVKGHKQKTIISYLSCTCVCLWAKNRVKRLRIQFQKSITNWLAHNFERLIIWWNASPTFLPSYKNIFEELDKWYVPNMKRYPVKFSINLVVVKISDGLANILYFHFYCISYLYNLIKIATFTENKNY